MLRLADGGEGAEPHRGDGERGDDLLPLRRRSPAKALERHAHEERQPPPSGAAAKKAVTGVGAPS